MKNLLFNLIYLTGITHFAAWWNCNKVLILCYHGVSGRTEKDELDVYGINVRFARFKSQLDYLQNNYNFISLSSYLSARADGKKLPSRSVVLTFDDGYKNFLTLAAPYLAKKKIPACVYIITDKIRNKNPEEAVNFTSEWTPGDDKSFLSWNDLNALKKYKNIEFGSHTCSHPSLVNLNSTEVENELRNSFEFISNHFNEPVSLSYPMGMYNQGIAERARLLGYTCALTTDQGANSCDEDLFTLKRTMVGDNDDEASFAIRVSGTREWIIKFNSIVVFCKNKTQLLISSVRRPNKGQLQPND